MIRAGLNEMIKGFTIFLDFDIRTYAKENNDFPLISVLNKQIRTQNLKFKEDEAMRNQINSFYNLVKSIFYELDDDLELTTEAYRARRVLIMYIRGESAFEVMLPMAVTLGLIIGSWWASEII